MNVEALKKEKYRTEKTKYEISQPVIVPHFFSIDVNN